MCIEPNFTQNENRYNIICTKIDQNVFVICTKKNIDFSFGS